MRCCYIWPAAYQLNAYCYNNIWPTTQSTSILQAFLGMKTLKIFKGRLMSLLLDRAQIMYKPSATIKTRAKPYAQENDRHRNTALQH